MENNRLEERNCEILFEYLRSILYDADIRQPDLSALDEPFQKLGKGLQYLERSVRELKEYTAALSVGDLSHGYPSSANPLCDNLKNIQANLNHLTWQAKQVAKGDYSQTVSYLGDFSKAFNTMTAQLREREEALKRTAQQEKEYADLLEQEAYHDLLTGIGNRYDLNNRLLKLKESSQNFTFCFCDLDHLKYVNDTFGHDEGDRYLCSFVKTVQNHLRETDIFARVGGDEFCIVLIGCPQELAQRVMLVIQNDFLLHSPADYQQHFSFGLASLPKGHDAVDFDALFHQTDAAMYIQKKQHKEQGDPFIRD